MSIFGVDNIVVVFFILTVAVITEKHELTKSTSEEMVKLLVRDGILSDDTRCMEPIEMNTSYRNDELTLTIRLVSKKRSLPVRYDVHTGQRICSYQTIIAVNQENMTSTSGVEDLYYYSHNASNHVYIGRLTNSQVWIVAICSLIIGTMFIIAIYLRIRNHLRRIYNDDPTANRHVGMSPYSGQSYFNNNDLFQRT